jgi:hypothetical protein
MNVQIVELSEEEDESFCIECVWKLTQCPEILQSGSSAVHAIDGPMTVAPYSATSVFAAAAALMTILSISRP